MPLSKLDHVNIRTANLDRMVAFYRDILGLTPGYRPPFPFAGAWLYCHEQPVVHLIGVGDPPRITGLRIEHFAFAATGLAAFLDGLRAAGVAYRVGILPELGSRQINILDVDGNHLHVDFGPDEEADLGDYDGR